MITMAEDNRSILFSRERIAQEVKRIGQEISRDFQDQEVMLVGVLKGSFLFIADLIREIEVPSVIDFVRLASYGSGTQTSGIIEFRKELEMPIRGRNVIIVEDIIDSGYTLECLYNKLLLQEPRTLKICTLIDKKARREVEIEADYVGITMDDGFIIGYGLDHDEKYRNLPDIYVVDEE
ncbi:hypoxanthine phosphoribosyltransferase [Pelobacter seleniigenes]|uniref:hypoxanthine phosphoribosyltransferase n=1 Tax=Pelobacter seleniigenes TaxID=407188 RepID=UPI000563C0EF|nr:hypoxanthine phosphoribosyltransferase [Pelobacter seleniigenes]